MSFTQFIHHDHDALVCVGASCWCERCGLEWRWSPDAGWSMVEPDREPS